MAIACSLAPDNTTADTFQKWASGLSAAIQTTGITKTTLQGFGTNCVIARALNGAAATSPAWVVPMHVAVSDIMCVSVVVATGSTVATPAGWAQTRFDTAAGGTGPVIQYIYTRTATSADTYAGASGVMPTYTFTVTSGAWTSCLYIVRGATGVDVQGVASSSINGTTATAPAVTTSLYNETIATFWAADCTTNTLASFSAGTARSNRAAAAAIVAAVTDQIQAAAGGSTQPTATVGSTGSWIAARLAFTNTVFVPTLSDSPTGGTLTNATYYYRVSATNVQGETIPCPEVSIVVADGTNTSAVTVTWPIVVNATGYKVYGRTTGAELLLATVASPNGTVLTWTDNGSLTPAGALNATDTTTDTGQVNWGAVAAPTIGQKAGYEVYQLTDSLQATGAPVFIRLDYGANAAGATLVQMWSTIGTSTDGVGNPTAGALYTGTLIAAGTLFNSLSGTSSATIYVDSDGGSSLLIAGWNQIIGTTIATTYGTVSMFERTRNWDGTANTEGLYTLRCYPGASGVRSSQVMIIANAASFAQPAVVLGAGSLIAGNQTMVPAGTALAGGTIYTVPVFTGYTPRMNGPSKHVVGMYLFDMPANTQFTATLYGVSRTFVAGGYYPVISNTGWGTTQTFEVANAFLGWRIS